MILKATINSINTRILLDNGSQADLVNEPFARANKLDTFPLTKRIRMTLGDGSFSQWLTHGCLVPITLDGHQEQALCYVARIGTYPIVLGDSWLRHHDPSISFADRIVTFNSAACFKHGCLAHGKPCTVRATDCRLPQPETKKQEADIQFCSAATFLRLANKKDHQGFVLNRASDKASFAATTTAAVKESDYYKFMKGKGELTKEDRLNRLPKEYHWIEELWDIKKADELAPHRLEDHEINLKPGSEPPYVKNYKPMSAQESDVLWKYIQEHLGKGWIRPSTSHVSAPTLVVRKPSGGLRVCVDYRALNAITEKNRYPIPNINETLTRLNKAKIFTKLDVVAAFNKIRIKEGHEHLTSFNTRFGQYEYLVMPFGLCNAPATFQSYINSSVLDYLDQFCTAYLDDVLVYSENEEEHIEHVNKVLKRLKDRGLQLDIDKCEFNVKTVKYLGLIVGVNGIQMDPEKVEAILNWEVPASVKDVQAFLGFANFYRRFIRHFSRLSRPLTELTKGEHFTTRTGKRKMKYSPFSWGDKEQSAFEELKKAFTTAPILAHYDPEKETWVETDASDFVTAGVLSQMHGDVLKPIAFFSKKMSPAETNYMIYDKELLAIIRSFETWEPELIGAEPEKPIKVLTDHKNLQYYMSTKQLTSRQARWAEFLSAFNFTITYRPGKQGEKPDSLTRRS